MHDGSLLNLPQDPDKRCSSPGGGQLLAFDKKLQPALLPGGHDVNRAFAQFDQPDAAMIYQTALLFILEVKVVERFRLAVDSFSVPISG